MLPSNISYPRDAEALADAMELLVLNSELIERMERAGSPKRGLMCGRSIKG